MKALMTCVYAMYCISTNALAGKPQRLCLKHSRLDNKNAFVKIINTSKLFNQNYIVITY